MENTIVRCNVTQKNIFELLQKGIISCVTCQDWSVKRVSPDFFDFQQFRARMTGVNNLLHLGIGDGECYRYFDNEPAFKQYSISDRLYLDPVDIIFSYLIKCNIPEEVVPVLSEIMRNEFLLSLSVKKLKNIKKVVFDKKDYYIWGLLQEKFIPTNSHSFSYNVLLLLLHILNTDPDLLLPTSSAQRLITPMGNHIVRQKITIPYSLYKKEFNAVITIDDVARIAMDKFSAISEIYLSNFENLLLGEHLKFDYILAVRSDAFLGEKYVQFVLNIVKHLKRDGFYISDGILSSYSYELFYKELNKMIAILGENRIYLVKSVQKSETFPLKEICGIIVLGEDASVKNIYSFIPSERLISSNEILKDESYLRQCIWSDLFSWALFYKIDLEMYQFQDITNLIDKYVDLKRKNQYFVSIFSNNKLFFEEFDSK